MIRLFTAVGTYKLEESGIPVILADQLVIVKP